MSSNSRNSDAQLFVFVGTCIAAFIVWRISVAVGLDIPTTLIELVLLPAVCFGYIYGLASDFFEMTLKNSFFFFLAILFLCCIPALNYYASVNNPFSYLNDEIAWYGKKLYQSGIVIALCVIGFIVNKLDD